MPDWSINTKTRLGLAILLFLVFALTGIGLYSLSLFRDVVRDIAWRTRVLPVSAELNGSVGEMRTIIGELRGIRRLSKLSFAPLTQSDFGLQSKFLQRLDEFKSAYGKYDAALRERKYMREIDSSFQQEFDTFQDIKPLLIPIESMVDHPNWWSDDASIGEMESRLGELRALVEKLPGYLHSGLTNYSNDIRRHYNWLAGIMVGTTAISLLLFGLLLWLSYRWIFKPLRILIDGSRMIAAGTFQHRISLQTHDEMAELADAMNRMTARFEEIRNDLDRQVRIRTQEVVRSEQLASVGFLAAGVAHEINNPLASIAMSAESLQGRLRPILEKCAENQSIGKPSEPGGETFDTTVVFRYLTMIQDEAFRCKGITEKLLDLSRTGNKRRERTDLAALIGDLVEMLSQHGSYKEKHLLVDVSRPLVVSINPQEIKQVVLNLMINALDFVPVDGTVRITLEAVDDRAAIEVSDNGIGMSESVLANVFKPFFTRRPQGQGTGLGLSISHRIIYDHGGVLEAHSDGPGRGSTFRIELPMN